MEKEQLYNLFNQYHPLSAALKAYLNSVLVKESIAKGNLLLTAGQVPINCWFLAKGSARVYIDTITQQATTWFWHQDEMIYPHSGFFTQTPTEENIELLEDSILFSLSFTALPKLIRLFPAFYKIEHRLLEVHQQDLIEQNIDLKELSAEERYVKFLGRFPKLMNTNFKKDIASFLGMAPDTLCRLRGKK